MSKSNIKVIIVLLCLVIAGGTYLYVYKPNKEATDSAKSETESLEVKLADLQEKNKHRDEYIEMTEQYYADFNEVVKDFPATLDNELTVMFIKGIEDNFNQEFLIGNASMPVPSEFYTLGGVDSSYQCYQRTVPITYTGNYENVKQFMEYIMNYKYRMNIASINIAYDAENDVATGSINMNQYCVFGEGRTPDTLDLDVELGVDNLFIGGEGAATNTNFAYDADNGAVIKTTNDIKIVLSSANNDSADGVVVAAGNDSTNVSSNSQGEVSINLDIFAEDGKNYATYSIDDKNYTVELTGNDVKIYVASSKRTDADDKNVAKLNINNKTDLSVFVKVDDDDATSPRFKMGSKTGTVKVY